MSDSKHIPTEETNESPVDNQSPHTAEVSSDAESPRQAVPSERKGFFSRIQLRTVIFGILAIVAIACFIIAYNGQFSQFINRIGSVLSPILLGCALAYLCHPILEFYEYRIFRRLKNNGVRRGLSLFMTVISFFAIIVLFILLIVPELISSIQTLVVNYDGYVNSLLEWLRQVAGDISTKLGVEIPADTIETVITGLNDTFGSLRGVLTTISGWLINSSDITIGAAGTALMAVANLLKDLVLSLFIAFYILVSLDKRKAQLRKFRRAVFNEKQDQKITEIVALTDRTFSGFLFSILVDAIVVGILTFVLLSIFEVSPYNLLIATTMAVTNIIPVFGPFIGAIPSAFIVLISNPSKLLLFILLMLLIQQVDGNILCPKIQGDNTGVSSLSVLIAITIAGSLWGIGGMVIGVPVFAVIIELGKRAIENRLRAKGEPTDTTVYYPKSALTNAEKDVYYDHAGLRYAYDHSKFKGRFERFRRRFWNNDRKAPKSDAEVTTETTESTENDHTESNDK